MCSSKEAFTELHPVSQPLEVTLGDGHKLNVVGEGVVSLKTRLRDGSVKPLDVLYIQTLVYNLLSCREWEDDKFQ